MSHLGHVFIGREGVSQGRVAVNGVRVQSKERFSTVSGEIKGTIGLAPDDADSVGMSQHRLQFLQYVQSEVIHCVHDRIVTIMPCMSQGNV